MTADSQPDERPGYDDAAARDSAGDDPIDNGADDDGAPGDGATDDGATDDGETDDGAPNDDAGDDDWWRYALRGLQLLIAGLIVYGAVSGSLGLVVNGLLGLGATLVPRLLAWKYGHEVDTRLALWIGLAVMGHVVGFLGLYEIHSGPLRFYDQVAHFVSASFVAGLGYAMIDALDRNSDRITFPDEFRFAFTIVFILAVGVTWEIVEFSVGAASQFVTGQEALVQYGLSDTIYDLTANTLAAVALALWGTSYFSDVAAIFSRSLFDTDRS